MFFVAGCNSKDQDLNESKAKSEERLIVIQGPMPIEAEIFADKLENVKIEKSGTFVFYKGKLNDYPIIVTKTGKGMEIAAATA